jgi:hypothetical protein
MRKLSRMLDAIARLSYVPATGKGESSIYMLPICTIVWCGFLPVARTPDPKEDVGVAASQADAEAANALDKGAAKCS